MQSGCAALLLSIFGCMESARFTQLSCRRSCEPLTGQMRCFSVTSLFIRFLDRPKKEAQCRFSNPCVFTSIKPAWNSTNLHRLADKIRSPLVFAHVRAAYPVRTVPGFHFRSPGLQEFLFTYQFCRGRRFQATCQLPVACLSRPPKILLVGSNRTPLEAAICITSLRDIELFGCH